MEILGDNRLIKWRHRKENKTERLPLQQQKEVDQKVYISCNVHHPAKKINRLERH